MKVTMYTMTVPMFARALEKLSKLLDKTVAFAAEKQISINTLLAAQLAPDQYPLTRQIQVACDVAKGCVARLAGVEIPSFPDTEKTVDELKARIAKTIEFLRFIPPEKIEDTEEKMIDFPYVKGKVLSGYNNLTELVLPNFYFHVTTAYSILRHNGLQIGKMDYIDMPDLKDKAAS